jgi:hypothetical protein
MKRIFLVALISFGMSVLPGFANAAPGQLCGGFTNVQCASGDKCLMIGGTDYGVCVKDMPAGPGEVCGGFAKAQCDKGLQCVLWEGADAGICVVVSQKGGFCGGLAAIQCTDGLKCKLS